MPEQRFCQNCGDAIIKRENENNFRYKTRKYCSDDCYHKYMRNNKLGWYKGFQVRYNKEEEPTTP